MHWRGPGRDRGEWVDLPKAEGEALVLDPHLYPENQKRQKILVNQYGMAERVGFEPTVRLPVQRFSSSMILMLACIAL